MPSAWVAAPGTADLRLHAPRPRLVRRCTCEPDNGGCTPSAMWRFGQWLPFSWRRNTHLARHRLEHLGCTSWRSAWAGLVVYDSKWRDMDRPVPRTPSARAMGCGAIQVQGRLFRATGVGPLAAAGLAANP